MLAPNSHLISPRAEATESASTATRGCVESSENERLTLTRRGSGWNTLEEVSLQIAQAYNPVCRSAENTVGF